MQMAEARKSCTENSSSENSLLASRLGKEFCAAKGKSNFTAEMKLLPRTFYCYRTGVAKLMALAFTEKTNCYRLRTIENS